MIRILKYHSVVLDSLIFLAFYVFSSLQSARNIIFFPFIQHIENSFDVVPSTRLNYFRIFLYFSVVRPNLSDYLCSQQVCSAIPRLRAWNSPSRRHLASTCFPTTIYDVMKRIRSAFESFLPPAASSRSTDSLHPLVLSYLSDSLANHSRYPLTSTIYSALLFLLSTSRTSLGRNELIRTSRFRGVSFTVLQVPRLSSTIRWRFTIPFPTTSIRAVWQVVYP